MLTPGKFRASITCTNKQPVYLTTKNKQTKQEKPLEEERKKTTK